MLNEGRADVLARLAPLPRRRYQRAARMLDAPALMGRLAAEVARMDPLAASEARVLAGRARLARARRIGVFAGSFNPLTLAHVALADAARASARLDAVLWLVSTHTVNKERVERAALPDRLAQLVAFVCGAPGHMLALTNRGLYVEEARALRAALPSGAELLMLVGFDKVAQIFDARYYANRDAALRALFAEASLLAAPRAWAGRVELESLLSKRENQPFAGRVTYIEMAPMFADESSTIARGLAAENDWQQLGTLAPPEALALAIETGAYAAAGSLEAKRASLRQRWLRALVRCDVGMRRALCSFTELERLTALPGPSGGEVRGWLEAAAYEPDVPSPPVSLSRHG